MICSRRTFAKNYLIRHWFRHHYVTTLKRNARFFLNVHHYSCRLMKKLDSIRICNFDLEWATFRKKVAIPIVSETHRCHHSQTKCSLFFKMCITIVAGLWNTLIDVEFVLWIWIGPHCVIKLKFRLWVGHIDVTTLKRNVYFFLNFVSSYSLLT